jgi:hypothetical protein
VQLLEQGSRIITGLVSQTLSGYQCLVLRIRAKAALSCAALLIVSFVGNSRYNSSAGFPNICGPSLSKANSSRSAATSLKLLYPSASKSRPECLFKLGPFSELWIDCRYVSKITLRARPIKRILLTRKCETYKCSFVRDL